MFDDFFNLSHKKQGELKHSIQHLLKVQQSMEKQYETNWDQYIQQMQQTSEQLNDNLGQMGTEDLVEVLSKSFESDSERY